ncbi:M28 family peptidase [Bacteroidota bacterium]
MKRLLLLLLFAFIASFSYSQFNMHISNPEAEDIVYGNYNPANYLPSVIINHPDSILFGLINNVNKDTLQAYLEHLETFYNRNSGSDTVSEIHGIGAARRWIHKKFMEYSSENESRLVVSYLDFDHPICGAQTHRNVFGILPGLDTTKKDILFIEGHFDTRCEGGCDTSCYTPGMDDNGSGTVLVMELARLMSRYAFDHTIIFTTVTGEDQGLWGAKAFAKFFLAEGIQIKACFNNDVVGGVICGNTSSPPSCPYMNHFDSTHVRLFSYSENNDSAAPSPHKQFARYVKLTQEEDINPLLNTPMDINIIMQEDRTGRSGDHIPFRQRGFTALRFCSQNEHGDGSGTPPDRQHTTNDILGLDLSSPPDGIIDSFFVDMGYLRRNAISNGVNLGYLGISPPMPDPVFNALPDGIEINMQNADTVYKHYRVGQRSKGSGTLYWDTVYTFTNTSNFSITGLDPGKKYYFSVANVDDNVAGLFCEEFTVQIVGLNEHIRKNWNMILKQNRPNPFDDHTEMIIEAGENLSHSKAEIIIQDISGRLIHSIPLKITSGTNVIRYNNDRNLKGLYTASLKVEGNIVQSIKMTIL